MRFICLNDTIVVELFSLRAARSRSCALVALAAFSGFPGSTTASLTSCSEKIGYIAASWFAMLGDSCAATAVLHALGEWVCVSAL
jgi:hypothetical protein